MGNSMSEEEENAFLEEAYNMTSIESPDFDRSVNLGTAAPNCQPKHTVAEKEASDASDKTDSAVLLANDKNSSSSGGGKGRKLNRSESDRRRRNEREEDTERKLSYIQMAKIGYQELVNAIIRPPRADYKIEALGPPAFTFCNRRFTRTDFTLVTKRGLSLQCSHWEPVERISDRIPCVIYMHGNSSARVEVIPQLSYLLSLGLAVFSFDFAGSGKSDGDYVSLGYFEREDLMCIIAHLRATNVVSTIALWGRSMGAATALMHGDRDPSIACMILDSSFADLTQLAEEMVDRARDQGINVPNMVASLALRFIRGSVLRQAKFDIRHISPIDHADKCFIPALFVAGEHDDFIHKRHSQAIHARYAGDKNLIIVEGDHNSPRPKFMFDSVSIFLQTCLQIPNAWALKIHPSMNLMAPPWFFPGNNVVHRTIRRVESDATKKRPNPRKGRNSAPPSRQSSQEIGMTLERQREIQASLFKMLGQADEVAKPKKDPPKKLPKPPVDPNSKAGKFLGVEEDSSTPGDVNHSATFPPQSQQESDDIQRQSKEVAYVRQAHEEDVRDGVKMSGSDVVSDLKAMELGIGP